MSREKDMIFLGEGEYCDLETAYNKKNNSPLIRTEGGSVRILTTITVEKFWVVEGDKASHDGQ